MWSKGTIDGYDYWVKHYETGSQHGIGGGRISKLVILKERKPLYSYDRGLDFYNLDKPGKAVYSQILAQYN
ncbi:MAG: hypothetical protein FWE19_00325 [Oscillospiraceae bacterium]|nr:hypothetical protein [Oscillospiraceae bacterium]